MNNPKTFFDDLIDDFGIRHHTDGQKWLINTGYSLDDAARGLVLCLALGQDAQAKVLLSYIEKSRVGSDFYGFATSDQQFNTYPSSEDAKGQVVWALGYGVSKGFQAESCKTMLLQITHSLAAMTHVRGFAYSLLGAVYFDPALAAKLAAKIQTLMQNRNDSWYWPEEQMTYGNGIIPYCLLRYAIATGDQTVTQTGQKLLNFLQQCCELNRPLGPIGNDGWFSKGQAQPADYSQQPVDVTYIVLGWLAEYELSGDKASLAKAKIWLDWFDGKNIIGQKMYDPANLKCFDGIDKEGINYHSGAESNLCFLLARELYKNQTTV